VPPLTIAFQCRALRFRKGGTHRVPCYTSAPHRELIHPELLAGGVVWQMSGVTGLAVAAATVKPVSGCSRHIRTGRHLRGGPVGAGGASTLRSSSNSARVVLRHSRRVAVTAQRSDGSRPVADAARLLRGAAGAGLATTTVDGCPTGSFDAASAAGGVHTVCCAASGRRRRRSALAATQRTQVNSTQVEEDSEREMYAAVEGMDLGRLPFSEPIGQGALPS
jgi:hypothetical protein